MHRLAEEPGTPLRFKDPHFVLVYGPREKTQVAIYYCFFCGGRAPARKRKTQFHRVTQAESNRLQSVVAGIESLAQAVTKLGPPDRDLNPGATVTQPATAERGELTECFRVFIYTKLSEIACVRFTERRDGGVRVAFEGKPVHGVRAQ